MIPQLALRLVFGMACLWLVLPRRDITPTGFCNQLTLACAAAVLAMLTVDQIPVGPAFGSEKMRTVMFALACGLAQLTFVSAVSWSLDRPLLGISLAYAAGLVAAIAVIFPSLGVSRSRFELTRLAWDAVSSGLLLGTVTSALVIALETLKIERQADRRKFDPFPLLKCTFLLGIAAVLRMVFSLLTLSSVTPEVDGFPLLMLLKVVGLLAPLGLAVVAFRQLRTGQLRYAVMSISLAWILVCAGEISAGLLSSSRANQLGL